LCVVVEEDFDVCEDVVGEGDVLGDFFEFVWMLVLVYYDCVECEGDEYW